MELEDQIFRKQSTIHYWSSKFFPANVREDVYRFYSFVHVARDYVDSMPVRSKEFKALHRAWNKAKSDQSFDTTKAAKDNLNERVIKNIVYIVRTYDCDLEWVEAFFGSMDEDLKPKVYKTLNDTLHYVYGSAEVVGLIMTRILRLPEDTMLYAGLQGRAMQFLSFLRDIADANARGRLYFPEEDLERFMLPDLKAETVDQNHRQFEQFMHFELHRYREWQDEASEGYRYIPRRLRIPLQTAADMYNWTAARLEEDPFVVFDEKVRPSKHSILRRAAANLLFA